MTELIATFIALFSLILLVLFFPAIFELKKPKDGGPRLIPEVFPLQNSKIIYQLVDIDNEQKGSIFLLHRINNILAILPNLEV